MENSGPWFAVRTVLGTETTLPFQIGIYASTVQWENGETDSWFPEGFLYLSIKRGICPLAKCTAGSHVPDNIKNNSKVPWSRSFT